jgi:hypothetical protein
MQALHSDLVIAASCCILPSSYCHVSMHMMKDKLIYYSENTVRVPQVAASFSHSKSQYFNSLSFHKFHCSPDVIRMIKSGRMTLVGHIA